MRVIDLLPFALLAATVAAVPQGKPGMRLIKTSEDAPAIWVTEDEKFDLYMAKRIHFIDITDTQDLEAIGAELHAASLEKRQSTGFPANPTRQTEVRNLQASINTNNIRTWMTTFTGYYNRYYGSTYGVQASNWLFEQVKTQAAANSKITVRQVTHSSFSQKSIVARIPGTGTGVIVIGAHLDSVGSTRAGRSPGADDNASGSVSFFFLFTLYYIILT